MPDTKPIDIPRHATYVADFTSVSEVPPRWRCACGEDRVLAGGGDVFAAALAHEDEQAAILIKKLPPAQLAVALRRRSVFYTPAQCSAVELVIAHGHWLGRGYLRRFMAGDWADDGEFAVGIRWPRLRVALGMYRSIGRELRRDDEALAALAAVNQYANRAEAAARADGLVISGSSSEVAVLKVAAALACDMPIRLSDMRDLGTVTRGLVLTAISHAFTDGGQTTIPAHAYWQAAAPTATSDNREDHQR